MGRIQRPVFDEGWRRSPFELLLFGRDRRVFVNMVDSHRSPDGLPRRRISTVRMCILKSRARSAHPAARRSTFQIMATPPRLAIGRRKVRGPIMPRATVCQVLFSLTVGGAEVLAARLARRLSGSYRTIFCCLDDIGPLGEELRDDGFPVYHLERRSGLNLAQLEPPGVLAAPREGRRHPCPPVRAVLLRGHGPPAGTPTRARHDGARPLLPGPAQAHAFPLQSDGPPPGRPDHRGGRGRPAGLDRQRGLPGGPGRGRLQRGRHRLPSRSRPGTASRCAARSASAPRTSSSCRSPAWTRSRTTPRPSGPWGGWPSVGATCGWSSSGTGRRRARSTN